MLPALLGQAGPAPPEAQRQQQPPPPVAPDYDGVGDPILDLLERRGVRSNPYRPGRSAQVARRGMVATSHGLASQAGLEMLKSGGTAMDAAIAAAAVLAVVEPMSTGLGGDAFFLYYEAATGKVHGLNGSGRAPRALTRANFDEKGLTRVPQSGWEAVTVPGAVDAWARGLERFGKKTLAEVLRPAIHYAEQGFPVAEIVSYKWKGDEAALRADPYSARTYLRDGLRAPARNSVFRLPALAASLREIASGGRDAFYRGPIAAEISRYARESGGFLREADFAAHESTWVEPIHSDYKGYRVLQIPPNGQGIGVLLMLEILEGFDLRAMGLGSPAYLHHLIEAKKLAYADLERYVADPEQAEVPLDFLLSPAYAADRRARIDPQRAAAEVLPVELPSGHDTIYLATVDAEGNACSFINSIYANFGSKLTGGETGILLQNRGAGFTLERGHRNEYAPGKRPFHTIIPGMVLREGELYMTYGLMGGPMQPQGHAQFLLSHLEFGLDPQAASDYPRWFHAVGKTVLLEHGTPRETRQALRVLGHDVHPAGPSYFGGAQAVLVHPETGVYVGSSDSRKDGIAVGY